jgi:anti-sigma factor RsiW
VVRRSIIGRAQSAICREIAELLLDYMTGELDPETASAFEEHLRLCSDCVAFLNTYKKTVQVTRSLRHDSIPAELQRRALRFLKERTKKGRKK